jgi:hypothetical protein
MDEIPPGVNVMITVLGDCTNFKRKKLAIFSKIGRYSLSGIKKVKTKTPFFQLK